jgi:hypothetical protein
MTKRELAELEAAERRVERIGDHKKRGGSFTKREKELYARRMGPFVEEIGALIEAGRAKDRAHNKRFANKLAVAKLARRLSKLPKSKQAYWLKRLTQLMKG